MQANRGKALSAVSDRNLQTTNFSLTLRFNGKILLLGVLLLPLLIWLGFWQLERANEKRHLQQYIAQQQALPTLQSPNLLDADSASEQASWRYRLVSLSGHFDRQHYWFVDNKVYQSQVGYEVIVPLLLESGSVVLVNLGWVKAPPLREQLPTIQLPAGPVTLQGRFYRPQANQLVRNLETQSGLDAWPRRVQQLELDQAESQLGRTLFKEWLQLSADDPSAFIMVWRDINVSPAKHIGYAVQWFAMAMVLVIALLLTNSNLWQWLQQWLNPGVKQK